MWDGFWVLANGAFWKRQTQQIRDIVAKRFREAALAERQDLVKLTDSLRTKLTQAGMTFVEPDRPAFREALNASTFYKDWRDKFGAPAWTTLERYTGKLG